MSEAASAKICVKCGTDCAGKPRTKDTQGRYTCKPCFDAAQKAAKPAAAKAAPKPKAVAPPDDDASLMASLLESSPSSLTQMCPSCGNGMAADAVVCMICGYNKQTGQGTSARVDKGPSKAASMALGAASAVGGLAAGPMALVLALVGASICGIIGACVWAFVAYKLDVEIGWLAWGVGVLVGVGAAAGARSHSGLMTGVGASVVALLSVFGGRYAAISMLADDFVKKQHGQVYTLTDEDMLSFTARDVTQEFNAAGKNFRWPEGVEQEKAHGEDEFPAPIWTEAAKRWEGLGAAEREHRKAEKQAWLNARINDKIKSVGFMATFGLIDVLWVVLAVGSAFSIGSGMRSVGGGGSDD